jgi:hypothetical protein
MKFRFLVLMSVLSLFVAGVIGCGEDPSVRPKAATSAKGVEKVKDTQKPVSD